MSGNYFQDASLFLVDTILGLYTLIVLLRFLFQLTRADFYNPVSQLIVKLSNPPVAFVRRIVPGFWGVDFASIVLLIGLEGTRIGLITLLIGHTPNFMGILVLSIAELLKLSIYVVVFSLFLRAVLSWINIGSKHTMLRLLYSFTSPLMAPARRILPATGGLDLSPILVFIVLMLVLKLLVQPLLDLGQLML